MITNGTERQRAELERIGLLNRLDAGPFDDGACTTTLAHLPEHLG